MCGAGCGIVPTSEREAVMKRLRPLLDAAPADANDLPMTETEVAELAAGGLFEIGGHTVSHPLLPMLDPGGTPA